MNTPEMLAIADPQTRERALSTFAAAMMVSWTFEKIEAGIWGSQIQLLQSLNTAPAGITREWIKENFFDVAQKQFPAWYSSYSFDQYLGFLSSFNLIAAGPMVAITEHGREYLVWRVRLGKSMKVNG